MVDIENILRRSQSATCGVFEKEIVVQSNKVEETKRKLRNKGFRIIGTSESGRKTRKIWFIRPGFNL
ncbi:hypothetical protein LCGC14_0509370 [marine sediment metagenome]|uniref:Uncharacterized protein n=1 Tax=marine sediment metagenome TaxID=412755 RepID=A0A0F9UN91_9ZZZZ|nr:hypothetical protein [bacterium]